MLMRQFLCAGALLLKYSNNIAPAELQLLNSDLESFLSEYQNVINASNQTHVRESSELAIFIRLQIAEMELKNKDTANGNCRHIHIYHIYKLKIIYSPYLYSRKAY
jgi:hypothetical protein